MLSPSARREGVAMLSPSAKKDYTHRIRVATGWLDENHPGWHEKIDIKKLDLSNPDSCICGQVFDDPYSWEMISPRISLETGVPMFGMFSSRKVERIWIKEIEKRNVQSARTKMLALPLAKV
jgi:hypothetical protein